MASERTTATLRNAEWNTVGPELAAKAEVQTIASGSWRPHSTRQWLPRLPARERNSDGQLRSAAEIASARLGHADGSPIRSKFWSHGVPFRVAKSSRRSFGCHDPRKFFNWAH